MSEGSTNKADSRFNQPNAMRLSRHSSASHEREACLRTVEPQDSTTGVTEGSAFAPAIRRSTQLSELARQPVARFAFLPSAFCLLPSAFSCSCLLPASSQDAAQPQPSRYPHRPRHRRRLRRRRRRSPVCINGARSRSFMACLRIACTRSRRGRMARCGLARKRVWRNSTDAARRR